jgi:hypothetical protein
MFRAGAVPLPLARPCLAPLIKAVQEQQAEIAELQKEIAALKGAATKH